MVNYLGLNNVSTLLGLSLSQSAGKAIFCLHFTTNENAADRQISLFGEGLARTNPNTTWIIIYITRSITDGYKLLFSSTSANSPCGIL